AQLIAQLRQWLTMTGNGAQQPDRREERVVIAEIAIGKEDMAAHLAREFCPELTHLGLDQGMTGLPHQRLTAEPCHFIEQGLARLDISDDGGTGMRGEDITAEDRQQLIAPDDAAFGVYRADTIAIAIESDAEIE